MKKLFFIFACAAIMAACGEDEPQMTNIFMTPTVVVSGVDIEVSCQMATQIQPTVDDFGFVYATITNVVGEYQTVSATSVSGNVFSAKITGLDPNVLYIIYAYSRAANKPEKSEGVSFVTGDATESPNPDPDPDPTPGPSDARYTGWAELPSQIEKPGEYYYAYHTCPDFKVNGQLARNFSVCYSNELKSAIWVAAPMHPCYKGPAKRTDAYDDDPKISISQPGKWDGYTRGHMLGSAERTVTTAVNRQVFYYSNIAPQYGQPYFNTGGGAWNTLEGWVDTQWENSADTTYQIIGGYWANKNKKVDGTTIPTHYYKVLLRTKGHKNKWVSSCSRGELQCIAVMVEHRTYTKAEVPQPSQYEAKGMLFTVKEMEQMTGQRFFANVPNAPKDSYDVADWGL